MLFHKAQPLNNLGSDIIDLVGETQMEYKEIISHISNLGLNGKHLCVGDAIIIYYTEQEFLIKTTPIDKDVANRLSPIITYGEFPKKKEHSFNLVANDIERFATKINRQLYPNTLEEIEHGLIQAWENITTFRNSIMTKMLNFGLWLLSGAFLFRVGNEFMLFSPTIDFISKIMAMGGFIIFVIYYIPQTIKFFTDSLNKSHKSRTKR